MEHAFTEFPLALFTTFAPVGAGAFVALTIAFLVVPFTHDQVKRIGKYSFIALALAALGLIASFFHLASPGHALHVFAGVGTSPLSNEIVAALVFGVIALIYCISAAVGALKPGANKVFSCITALVALIFIVFTGLAYNINTIPSWASPATVVEILGFALFGGVLLGGMIVEWSDAYETAENTPFTGALLGAFILGLLLSFGGMIARLLMVNGMKTALLSGPALIDAMMPGIVPFFILMIVAAILGVIALRKNGHLVMLGVATLCALGAILAARLVFYGLQMSVGIQSLL